MSAAKLRFHVDSRLATLLSQEYKSTERALKELVDNAWDADADQVSIQLPKPLSGDPIIIRDDGTGMTVEELRRHYLTIARDRRSARGERTVGKNRQVKGRKGIGKFAGFMAASVMTLETRTRGKLHRIALHMDAIGKVDDIEQFDIALHSEDCEPDAHGTVITLSELHQGLAYPDANRLRQVLLQDYGRHDDFTVLVNGKQLDVDDIQGSYSEHQTTLADVGDVKLRLSIFDGKAGLRQPGVTLRVGGKAVGSPSFFGLEEHEYFPPKLLKKMYGEVDADGLLDHVTAGWDSLVENSEKLKAVKEFVQPILIAAAKEKYGMEIQLAHARMQKAIQQRLADLPEHKRSFANKSIRKILERYYDEPPSKIEPIVGVLLDALERSDYRILLEHIADASQGEVATIADRLNDFGLAEMAFLVAQAAARQAFLDQLEELACDPATTEAAMHKSLELSLWVFGPEYSFFSSNVTLKRQIEDVLNTTYKGKNADRRPDLLLNQNLSGDYLLIEFKRPSHSLNYDDYRQAIEYRHDFAKHITSPIRVVLIGGRLSSDFPRDNREPNVDVLIFSQVIASARRQVEWLLRSDCSQITA